MFIYDLVKAGPHSIFFPMGSCVNQIPFRSKRLILTTGSHEPNIILGENALSQLNDSLLTSSVIIQVSNLFLIRGAAKLVSHKKMRHLFLSDFFVLFFS